MARVVIVKADDGTEDGIFFAWIVTRYGEKEPTSDSEWDILFALLSGEWYKVKSQWVLDIVQGLGVATAMVPVLAIDFVNGGISEVKKTIGR